MTNNFDAIIIGGGHNGLVASAYMAKAGMSVLVLERRHLVGGACVTEELIPGFQFSSCAYLSWLLQPKVVKDLELHKHGLELYRLDPHSARPFPDGSGMLFWDDEERTKESVGRISPGDVEGYTAWSEFWDKAAEIMQPYMLQPPPTMEEVVERVRGTEHEDVLNTLVTVSMGELLDRYFESEKIKSCMVYSPTPGAFGSSATLFRRHTMPATATWTPPTPDCRGEAWAASPVRWLLQRVPVGSP